MNTRARIPTTLAVALTALLLAGCGDQVTTTTTDDRPAATAPTTPAAPVDAPVDAAVDAAVDEPVVDAQPEPTLDVVPLAAGWPVRPSEPGDPGLEVPVHRFTADFAEHACPSSAPPAPGRAEVRRGQYSSVEDYRTRGLAVLPDADAAVAWVQALEDFYAACPTVSVDGLGYPITVLETATGGQSFGVARSTTYEDHPAIGVSALHVVRLGRSVLLESVSNEGWTPDPRVDGRRLLDRMATGSAEVVAAMCLYTTAGCGDPS